MSYLMPARFLAVGRLLAMELQRVPVKVAADALDASDVTVKKMRRGELPNAVTLLRAIENFGLKILEPVLGPMDNASLARRLDLILAEVGDLKNVISPATAPLVAPSDRRLGEADRATGRSVEAAGGSGGHQVPGLALQVTSERLPLNRISSYPSLAAHLERFRSGFGRRVASDVLAYARGDAAGRVGVVLHVNGDVPRHAYKARSNRLKHGEPIIGQPVTVGASAEYAALNARTIAEAEASDDPVLARVFGFVSRGDGSAVETNVMVLRTVDRNNREASIASHFIPAFA